MNTKPYTLDRVVRMLIGLAILIGIFLLIKKLSAVLLPFLIAWLLAYLLNPIVGFFQNKLKFKNRILSIFTTLLIFICGFAAIIWFLTPLVINEVSKLSNLIVLYSKNFNVDIFLPIAWQNEIRNYLWNLNIQSALQDENIMNGIKKLAPQLWYLINGSLSFVFGLAVIVIIFLYLIFILLDYKKISDGLIEIIPPKHRSIVSEVLHDLEIGMNRYFRGQALVAIIVGILFSIGFSIIQLPLAIVFGLSLGLFNMVPYLQLVGVIPALLLALLRSAETGQSYWSVLLGIVIVFLVLQLIQDLILTPKIMGKVTGLNPAVILLSLSIWGSLMGVVGMIIALPMTTLMISYYKRFVLNPNQSETIIQSPEPEDKPIEEDGK
ncbi:MAG: AI-2E family transporter [Paludibacter sp.]|nr:AI-2E family transporter [Paludibacter sp.]